MGVLYSIIACLLSFSMLHFSWLHDMHKSIIRVVMMFFMILFFGLCFCKYNVAMNLMQVFAKDYLRVAILWFILLFGLWLMVSPAVFVGILLYVLGVVLVFAGMSDSTVVQCP